jgi:hypothetical protein
MKRLGAVVAAGLLLGAGAAAAAISVRTFPARPVAIHLTGVPHCTSLPYQLSVRADEVELEIVNAAGHEVWDIDRENDGLAPGNVFAFRWCGQHENGGKVAPGRYRWHVEADQEGSDAEARSNWRTITVLR